MNPLHAWARIGLIKYGVSLDGGMVTLARKGPDLVVATERAPLYCGFKLEAPNRPDPDTSEIPAVEPTKTHPGQPGTFPSPHAGRLAEIPRGRRIAVHCGRLCIVPRCPPSILHQNS